jgi:hypothetical protein
MMRRDDCRKPTSNMRRRQDYGMALVYLKSRACACISTRSDLNQCRLSQAVTVFFADSSRCGSSGSIGDEGRRVTVARLSDGNTGHGRSFSLGAMFPKETSSRQRAQRVQTPSRVRNKPLCCRGFLFPASDPRSQPLVSPGSARASGSAYRVERHL